MTITKPPHFVIFPFMSQGHIIPLLHLSRILSDRHITVTIITTTANYSTVKSTVKNHPISVINIPYPDNATTTPPGVVITNNIPCMASFITYVNSTQQLQPKFEEVVRSLQQVTCIISDGFLFWTQDSAEKLGLPRLVFNGMSIFAMTMYNNFERIKPHASVGFDGSENELFCVPDFPRIKLTTSDFDPVFSETDPKSSVVEFMGRLQESAVRSDGMVVNSFYELESEFIDYWDRNCGPKAWLVGPLCVAQPNASKQTELIEKTEKPAWIEWLDVKLGANEPVLYVSFGSQAEVSAEQLLEVAIGLAQSNVSFMWVVKPKQLRLIGPGFEETVKGRGKVVAEWVDQMEILNHEVVCGFLSHCGWNSVLESICSGVAILAMPLIAEQHLNARMVVEEIGIGLRLWPRDKVVRGVVEAEEVAEMAAELMKGEGGRRVRKRVKEVSEGAYGAMKEGGSSSKNLDLLIDHVCKVMHAKEHVKDKAFE